MTVAYGPPRPVESWGRIVRPLHRIAVPAFLDSIPDALRNRCDQMVLPIGLGRSYGDSNLNSGGKLIDMTRLDRVIAFDPLTGVLRAEAGLSLGAALQLIVPKEWFLKTTPGTRFVTLGGAVANDVHGKNHHAMGSFGNSVRRLGLFRSDGSYHELSATDDSALFQATIGGLGLTGVISWVELALTRIASTYLDFERIPFDSVGDFFRLAEESSSTFEHTVAWIDCANRGRALGRGIFQRANWCDGGGIDVHDDHMTLVMPFDAPGFALNRFTVRLFNALYYRLQRSGPRRKRLHYAALFYPLDKIRYWNRLYGARGLYQYQCIIPPAVAENAMEELVRQIVQSGAGSFLAVLKTLGSIAPRGHLSFPMEGATLALDFPNNGQRTLDLMARLDAVVGEAGGRLYAAKDGRMPAHMFRAGYPGLPSFARHVDPAFSSDFWKRVSA